MRYRALLLLVVGVLGGCSRRNDTLRFNITNDAIELDWNKANDYASIVLLDNLMEGLTSYSDELKVSQADVLRPMPALAKSWSIQDEGRTVRFLLRPGVEWTDGVPLTAQQFVDSWQRLLDPKTKSKRADPLFDIVGAEQYASGVLTDFSQVGVRAVDAQTLEVHLRRATPYFLHLVATVNTFPIRKDLIEKYGPRWTMPDSLVTLGPYRVDHFVPRERIVLEANSRYWGPQPAITRVICRMVAEPLTALSLYENGELDILPRDLPASLYQRWAASQDYRTGEKLSVTYLAFNVRKPPFDRVENRRAFVRSIERQKVAEPFSGAETPTRSLIPPGLLGHSTDLGLGFSGKETWHGNRQVTLDYAESDRWNRGLQVLSAQVLEHLRVNVRPQGLPWADYRQLLAMMPQGRAPKKLEIPNIVQEGWVADFPDPHNFMSAFLSTSQSNITGWKNKRYDKLVESAASTDIEARRVALTQEAQKLLLEEEVVIMPLFFASHQALIRDNIKGVVLNSLDKWYFANFRLEPK